MGEFCLDDYPVIGFDMDMTLARYRTAAMAEVTFEVVVKYLVQERSYPSQLENPMTEEEMLFLGKGLVVNYDDLSIDKVGKDGEIKISWNAETDKFDYVAKKWEGYEQYLQNGSSIRGKQHHIENVFELGLPVVFKRIAKLRKEKLIENLTNQAIKDDIFNAFEHSYEPYAFQVDRGFFFPRLKNEPDYFIRPCSKETKTWLLEMRKSKKFVFLMTSSNADFAKYILSKIFVDEKTGQPENYWKYFDICLADARKPYFFTMDSEFYTLKQDYADAPTSRLATDRWFSQGNHKTLVEFFKSHLKWSQHKQLEVCYFGDSSKSDVLSARKVASWYPVYLLEELNLKTAGTLDEADEKILSNGPWETVPLEETPLYQEAFKHAALVTPMIESISSLPLDHKFTEKIFIS